MDYGIESVVARHRDRYLPETLARAAIVEVGRRQYLRGFVAANDGNISVRIGDDAVLATPTGRSKGFLREDELVKIDLAGQKLQGPLAPSSEVKMHLAIYRARVDVKAVVHAHPPTCTGFAVAGIALDKCVLAEVVMTLGAIPLAEFAPPSTEELAEAAAAKIRDCDAVLLANHGAVTVGPDVFAAHYNMERLEHFANITLVARMLGGERLLTPREVQRIAEVQTASGSSLPGLSCRTCAERSPGSGLLSTKGQPDECEILPADERLVDEVVAAIKKELAEL